MLQVEPGINLCFHRYRTLITHILNCSDSYLMHSG